MARLVIILLLFSAVVAVAALSLAAIGGAADRARDALPAAPRTSGLQKAAFALLMGLMLALGSGLVAGD